MDDDELEQRWARARAEAKTRRESRPQAVSAYPIGWRCWPWSKWIKGTHDPGDPPNVITPTGTGRIGFRKWYAIRRWPHEPQHWPGKG